MLKKWIGTLVGAVNGSGLPDISETGNSSIVRLRSTMLLVLILNSWFLEYSSGKLINTSVVWSSTYGLSNTPTLLLCRCFRKSSPIKSLYIFQKNNCYFLPLQFNSFIEGRPSGTRVGTCDLLDGESYPLTIFHRNNSFMTILCCEKILVIIINKDLFLKYQCNLTSIFQKIT